MFGVFTTALMGVVIGAGGKAIMPTRDSGGLITTVTLGICGANLGASFGWLMGWFNVGSPTGYLVGAGCSVGALLIYRMFANQASD